MTHFLSTQDPDVDDALAALPPDVPIYDVDPDFLGNLGYCDRCAELDRHAAVLVVHLDPKDPFAPDVLRQAHPVACCPGCILGEVTEHLARPNAHVYIDRARGAA